MEQSVYTVLTLFPTFFLVLTRVSAFFLTAPIFSNQSIPTRIKLILSIIISLIVLPLIPPVTGIELMSINGAILIAKQTIIGIAAGFIFRLIFDMIILSGQVIAYQTGLGFATLVNPSSGISVPMISQIYVIAATLIFLAMNGHLMLIQFMVNSFHTLPLTTPGLLQAQLGHVIDFSKLLFSGAVSIALPSIIAILLVNFTFAIMTSSAPQLNIFTIGFPITLMLGLFVIYISFTGAVNHIGDIFHKGFNMLDLFMKGSP